MRCMECDRPSLNPLEFLGKIFLPLVCALFVRMKCVASLLVMVSLSLVRKEARYHCKGTLSRRNSCRNWTRGVSLEVSHNYMVKECILCH